MNHSAVDSLETLVAACEADFCCAVTEANEPDDSCVAFPDTAITFGHIRRARAAITALTRPPGGSERLREAAERNAGWQEGWQDGYATGRKGAQLVHAESETPFCRIEWESEAPDENSRGGFTGWVLADDQSGTQLAVDYGLASPQGAEQRQERCQCAYPGSELCKAYGHSAQAATQGDAVAERDMLQSILSRPAHAHLQGAHLSEPHADCVLCGAIKERTELRAALSSPPGVQAAQVSEAVSRLKDRVFPNHECPAESSAVWNVALYELQEALAQPGSAAHGGEDAK